MRVFAKLAVLVLVASALTGCDTTVNGGLTGALAEKLGKPAPKGFVGGFGAPEFCQPDDSLTNPFLQLNTPRTGLTFCEFEVPLARDRFTLGGLIIGEMYSISTSDLGPLADTVLEVFDPSSGTSTAFNDDGPSGFGRSSFISFQAATTSVIVEVRSLGQQVGPSNGYSVVAIGGDVSPPPDPGVGGDTCVADAFEGEAGNDEPATAFSLGSGTGAAGLSLNFCDDAVDYFSLNVMPGQSLTLNTFALGLLADTVLEVFAGNSELEENRLAFDDDSGTEFRASLAEIVVPPDVSSVLIKVTSFGGDVGLFEEYSLTTAAVPLRPELAPDASEPNDIAEEAESLGIGTPSEGIPLNFVDDTEDFFLLNAVQSSSYEISILSGGGLSTAITVFSPQGQVVATGNESANFFAGESGSYTVQITGFVFTDDSSYQLFVRSDSVGAGEDLRLSFRPGYLSRQTISLRPARTLLTELFLQNTSPQGGVGQYSFVLSNDPVIDAGDLRFSGGSDPQFEFFGGGGNFVDQAISLPADRIGIFYVGASIETDNLLTEVDERNNSQVIPAPLRLGATDELTCFDDSADVEFLSGPQGPGSGGDDRPSSSPFLAVVPPGTGVTFPRAHCVDTLDWSQIFVTAGQAVQITTSGLGPNADTEIRVYRNNGTELIAENDNVRSGTSPALNSSVRFVSLRDEILFVEVRSRTGSGAGREYAFSVAGGGVPEPLSDLVANIVDAPSAVTVGQALEVTAEVLNLGAGTATESTLQVLIACPVDGENIAIGSLPGFVVEQIVSTAEFQIPALAANGSFQVNGSVSVGPEFLPVGYAGSCRLVANADFPFSDPDLGFVDVVAESVESSFTITLGNTTGPGVLFENSVSERLISISSPFGVLAAVEPRALVADSGVPGAEAVLRTPLAAQRSAPRGGSSSMPSAGLRRATPSFIYRPEIRQLPADER